MASSAVWTNTAIEVAGTKLHLSRAGSGRPLLVLHHDIGTPDRLPFYDALARQLRRAGAAPSRLRPVGAAAMDAQRARHRGDATSGCWPSSAVERCDPGRARLRRLDRRRDGEPWRRAASAGWCWSGAMGIKPPEGDILDQAIVSYIDYAQAGFHDQEAFDACLRRRAAPTSSSNGTSAAR